MTLPIAFRHILQGSPVEWDRLAFTRGCNPRDVPCTPRGFASDLHVLGNGYILIGAQDREGRSVLLAASERPTKWGVLLTQMIRWEHVCAPSEVWNHSQKLNTNPARP
jgi:hypothetical protein